MYFSSFLDFGTKIENTLTNYEKRKAVKYIIKMGPARMCINGGNIAPTEKRQRGLSLVGLANTTLSGNLYWKNTY
jgi:hypothetical protein